MAQPPSDSVSADAQRLAAVNEGATKSPSNGQLNPSEQSTVDRVENFEQVAGTCLTCVSSPYFGRLCRHLTAYTTSLTQLQAREILANKNLIAGNVAQKMANEPENVTKDEANTLHSREQRSFGQTSKGGIASQAQSLASENEKKVTS